MVSGLITILDLNINLLDKLYSLKLLGFTLRSPELAYSY